MSTLRPTMRRASIALSGAMLVAACGSSAPTAPADGGGGGASELPGPTPTIDFSEGEPTGEETASLRLFNLYLDEEGAPEDVVLYVNGQEDSAEPPLTQVRYGTEDFGYETVPTDTSLRLFAAAHIDDEHAQFATDLSGYAAGDRITIVTYRQEEAADIKLGMLRIEEAGDEAFEDWPEAPADGALLMIYPGALATAPADQQAWTYATAAGECLVDAETGQPVESGFGGNIEHFFTLPAGDTAIQAVTGACDSTEVGIPAATVSAEAGDRWVLMPYVGQGGELAFFAFRVGAA